MSQPVLHNIFSRFQSAYATAREGILERAINHYMKTEDWQTSDIALRCTSISLPMGETQYRMDGQIICIIHHFPTWKKNGAKLKYYIPDRSAEPHEVII